jgi:DNA-binding NarL/FixJ family response regulator
MAGARTTVLLVDDFPPILEKLSQMLRFEFDIVGLANNGAAAVDAVKRLHPELVVMDISMPVMDGLQATREIRKLNLAGSIVILSALNDQAFVSNAFDSGCRGYVLKSRIGSDLVPALREVLAGGTFPCPSGSQLGSQSAASPL